MSNKKLILVSSLVAIIIIGAGLWIINRSFFGSTGDLFYDSENKGNDFESIVDREINYGDKQDGIISSAEQFNFLSFLTEEETEMIVQSTDYGPLLKHEKLCDLIEDKASQDRCLDNVELRQVGLIGKAEYCSKITQKDGCLESFALNKKDTSICNQMSKGALDCADSVNRALALNTEDTSYCELISDQEAADLCTSLVLFNLVQSTGNYGLCDQIPLDGYEQACKGEGVIDY